MLEYRCTKEDNLVLAGVVEVAAVGPGWRGIASRSSLDPLPNVRISLGFQLRGKLFALCYGTAVSSHIALASESDFP